MGWPQKTYDLISTAGTSLGREVFDVFVHWESDFRCILVGVRAAARGGEEIRRG